MSFGTPRYHQALADAVAYAAGEGRAARGGGRQHPGRPAAAGARALPGGLPRRCSPSGPPTRTAPIDGLLHQRRLRRRRRARLPDPLDLGPPGAGDHLGNGQAAPATRFLSGTSMAAPIVAGLGGARARPAARPDRARRSRGDHQRPPPTAARPGATRRTAPGSSTPTPRCARPRPTRGRWRRILSRPRRQGARLVGSCKVGARQVRYRCPVGGGGAIGRRLASQVRTAPALSPGPHRRPALAAGAASGERLGKVKTKTGAASAHDPAADGGQLDSSARRTRASRPPAGGQPAGAKVLVAPRRQPPTQMPGRSPPRRAPRERIRPVIEGFREGAEDVGEATIAYEAAGERPAPAPAARIPPDPHLLAPRRPRAGGALHGGRRRPARLRRQLDPARRREPRGLLQAGDGARHGAR